MAVVTGGLGDIGRAVVDDLARRGAWVAVSDLRRPDTVSPAVSAGIQTDEVDTTDADAVEAWLDAVTERFGVPTWIVANAAQVTLAPILEVTPEQWRREIDVNLTGAFLVAQAGARRLRDAGLPGAIVLVGSWAAHAPHPALPAYSVAKAGLRMLTRCLALEMAPHGVRVNEVAPGYVDAGLSRQVFEREPGLRERAAARVPTGAMLDPVEVARLVGFLLSDDARHVVGQALVADGGLSLRSPADQWEDRT